MLPGALVAAAVRRAARRATVVIVPSGAVALDLDPRGRLTDRLRVVNPGVDLERFGRAHVPAQPPEVLVLGALVAWKRPDLALEACAIARRTVPELRLRVAGTPLFGDEAVLRALRERSRRPDLAGAVEITGDEIDAAAALARASCLLHCAPAEPFGLVVAEALAAGCPAVVPAAGGPAEIVDQSCARTFAPGDADAAARALVEILTDPELRASLGAAGRRRARARFDRTRSRALFADALAVLEPPAVGPERSRARDRDAQLRARSRGAARVGGAPSAGRGRGRRRQWLERSHRRDRAALALGDDRATRGQSRLRAGLQPRPALGAGACHGVRQSRRRTARRLAARAGGRGVARQHVPSDCSRRWSSTAT